MEVQKLTESKGRHGSRPGRQSEKAYPKGLGNKSSLCESGRYRLRVKGYGVPGNRVQSIRGSKAISQSNKDNLANDWGKRASIRTDRLMRKMENQ